MKKSKAPEVQRLTKAYIAEILKNTDYPADSKDNLEDHLGKYKIFLESGDAKDTSDLSRV